MKIGFTSFAHVHADSYAAIINNMDGVEIAGILDEDEARGRLAAEKYNTTYFNDANEFYVQELDAVIITSENNKHKEQVIRAANEGKHILCEKPIATTIEDANQMIEVCENKGVILEIAFPVRFHTVMESAKQIIDAGKLGEIVAVKGTNRGVNPGGWFEDKEAAGGGAVMDHTVHVVDILRWMLKSDVKEVYAEIGEAVNNPEIDHFGIITMDFDGGIFATLDCSWSRNEKYPTWGDVTLEIVGTEGTLTVDTFAQKLDIYSNVNHVQWDYFGDDMDGKLISDFVETIKQNRSPFTSGEDGLEALKVAIAAYQSNATKSPVTTNGKGV